VNETASLMEELQAVTDGQATIAVRPETGALAFIGGSEAHPLDGSEAGTPSQVARRFIDHYGTAFGVASPATDLTELPAFAAGVGSAIRFQQHYNGVPVLAGEIAVQIGTGGQVLSTTGEVLPAVDVDINAQVSAETAAVEARTLTAKYEHVATDRLTASAPELWIYDPSLLGADGPPGTRLVWRVDVRTRLGDVDRLMLIDAHDGTVALQFSQREDSRYRSVCTNANNPALTDDCNSPVRTEGAPPYAGPGSADVNAAYDLSGLTYDFYFNSFARNSVDNLGMTLKSTVLYCEIDDCPMANAFWNGAQMVYGEGFAIPDDVVAHELTHGVTQYTSHLMYYGESGAISESMSDVMGELVDLSSTLSGPDQPTDRWLMGEQLPDGAIRSISDPTVFGDPDRMTSPLYFGGSRDSHGVHFNSGVNNKAAFLIADGATFNGQTVAGLGTTKTALIYYQAQTTLLGPGSDYLDLFHILPQACTNLIGTGGITPSDCTEVVKAVTATEMDRFPTTPGAHLSAPVCDAGAIQTSTLLSDDLEVGASNWLTSATTSAAYWRRIVGSSQSGTHSLYGPAMGYVASSTLVGTFSVAVPSGISYLRFDHSFDMEGESEAYYDGGIVEYSTDNGSTWYDAIGLPGPTVNGYTGTLESMYGNPLAGRQAFSGTSPGYETTRINLSSLSGNSVKLRFRIGSDNAGPSYGWFIDDIVVYTCGGSGVTPPAPPAQPSLSSLVPARLLETRGGLSTIDGQFNGIGMRNAGTTTALTVANRGGVSADPTAVILNVTVTDAQAAGYITVYPCGSDRPNASSLNYIAGSTVANAVIVKVGVSGQICLYTQSATNLITDITGYFT
jgi:Zn-dependent metalloprotease